MSASADAEDRNPKRKLTEEKTPPASPPPPLTQPDPPKKGSYPEKTLGVRIRQGKNEKEVVVVHERVDSDLRQARQSALLLEPDALKAREKLQDAFLQAKCYANKRELAHVLHSMDHEDPTKRTAYLDLCEEADLKFHELYTLIFPK